MVVTPAPCAVEPTTSRRSVGRGLATCAHDRAGARRPGRRLLLPTTRAPPHFSALCDLEDAVACFAFRELPCHLAVRATETSGRAHHGLFRATHGAGDLNAGFGAVRGTEWPAPFPIGVAVSVSTVWPSKLHVIRSSPCVVTEHLPRPVDSERLLRRFGQHLVGRAAVLVRVQKVNFDAPCVSDRIAICRRINSEDLVVVQHLSPCGAKISGGTFDFCSETAVRGSVDRRGARSGRSAFAFWWT